MRKTQNSNNLHQTTIGIEALSKHLEFRINGYIPFGKDHQLSNKNVYKVQFKPNTKIAKIGISNRKLIEKALSGFDIESGGSLPSISRIELYLAYYHFAAKDVSAVKGIRIRNNIRITTWLSIELESNYDGSRKSTNYGGFRLGWDIGASKSSKKTWIDRKMTQLPVRDIDIVHDQGYANTQVVRDREVNLMDVEAIFLEGADIIETDIPMSQLRFFKTLDEAKNSGIDTKKIASVSVDTLKKSNGKMISPISVYSVIYDISNLAPTDVSNTDIPKYVPTKDTPEDASNNDIPQIDEIEVDEVQVNEIEVDEIEVDEVQVNEIESVDTNKLDKHKVPENSAVRKMPNLKEVLRRKANARKNEETDGITPKPTKPKINIPTRAASNLNKLGSNLKRGEGRTLKDALKIRAKKLRVTRNTNSSKTATKKKKKDRSTLIREAKERRKIKMAQVKIQKKDSKVTKSDFADILLVRNSFLVDDSSDSDSSNDGYDSFDDIVKTKTIPAPRIVKKKKFIPRSKRRSVAVIAKNSKDIKRDLKLKSNSRKVNLLASIRSDKKTAPIIRKAIVPPKPKPQAAIFKVLNNFVIPDDSSDSDSSNDSWGSDSN